MNTTQLMINTLLKCPNFSKQLVSPTKSENVLLACQQAVTERTPIFVPTRRYLDDSGWSIMTQLHENLGADLRVSYSIRIAGSVKPWNLWKQKTVFWICLEGDLTIDMCRQDNDMNWSIVIGEQNPGIIIIPATIWHQANSRGQGPATLLEFENADCIVPPQVDSLHTMQGKAQGFEPWTS